MSEILVMITSAVDMFHDFLFLESDNASSHEAAELTCLCTVVVKGVYPTLAINDVRGLGCVQGYSRKRLWSLLSIDRYERIPSASFLMKFFLFCFKNFMGNLHRSTHQKAFQFTLH